MEDSKESEDKDIIEDSSESEDENNILKGGFIVEVLPDNNILIINKRSIYLFYIDSLTKKKDYYFKDNNSHKHYILDAKLVNNLIITSDNTIILIWEYTKQHFIQLNKKIKINKDDDDDIRILRLIKSIKYPKTFYIIFNNKIIQYNLINGELMSKYLLEAGYEWTNHFHEFYKPFTFYDKKTRKENFFYIKSENNAIIKLSEKNEIIYEFNIEEYYKGGYYYFFGKNEKQDCFYIFVNKYNSIICNIYCYDFNFNIISSVKIEYKNTLNCFYGDNFIGDPYDFDYIKAEFIDINHFYFIYSIYQGPPFEVISFGLGTSENCGKNILLYDYFYEEEGINSWGIKNLNKEQLLVWMGNDYKIIQKEQFGKIVSREGILNPYKNY